MNNTILRFNNGSTIEFTGPDDEQFVGLDCADLVFPDHGPTASQDAPQSLKSQIEGQDSPPFNVGSIFNDLP
jgi:hypothetical protein